ncbi:unnamed protein product, partial [Trichogramma brassicae]
PIYTIRARVGSEKKTGSTCLPCLLCCLLPLRSRERMCERKPTLSRPRRCVVVCTLPNVYTCKHGATSALHNQPRFALIHTQTDASST